MDRYSPITRSAAAAGISRASSVYSNQSEKKYSPANSSNASTANVRTASNTYTPSFMSHHATQSTERLSTPITIPPVRPHPNGQAVSRKPRDPSSPTVPNVSDPPPLQTPPGTLLVLAAREMHASCIPWLETLLLRQPSSGIIFVARKSQETAVKQLKMETYAVIGSLGKELAVTVCLVDEWTEVELQSLVKDNITTGAGIQGVLCFPEYATHGPGNADIVELEETNLEQSWRQSVKFLHTSMRATIKDLLSRCSPKSPANGSGQLVRNPRAPFFLVSLPTLHSAAAQITKSACDSILQQLGRSTNEKGLTVGYADAILIPDPTPKEPKPQRDEFLQPHVFTGHPNSPAFTPSESPTKLWNMWALQNDITFVDD